MRSAAFVLVMGSHTPLARAHLVGDRLRIAGARKKLSRVVALQSRHRGKSCSRQACNDQSVSCLERWCGRYRELLGAPGRPASLRGRTPSMTSSRLPSIIAKVRRRPTQRSRSRSARSSVLR
eukprot:2985080-Pleurochrysis_carterae.AAC.3